MEAINYDYKCRLKIHNGLKTGQELMQEIYESLTICVLDSDLWAEKVQYLTAAR
jgi:hypothetical protein